MNNPIIIKNFINRYAVDKLLDWSKNSSKLYEKHKSSISYWNSKCVNFEDIDDPYIWELLIKCMFSLRKIVSENDPSDKKLYAEYPQFVKWVEGNYLTPHADNCEIDGVTPNATPWRSHGGVMYLNDDFEGGEIFYPNLDNFSIKPEPGMAVIHQAGLNHLHGVKEVTKGVRHTISLFFTYNEELSKSKLWIH